MTMQRIETKRAGFTLYHGNALEVLPTLADASIDAVVSDPPYAEIDRPYGRLTEAAWMALMQGVVRETRRVLKPHGSAVFILQPGRERLGRMRPWLWDFMSWCCREWNIVQDAWWWNHVVLPAAGCNRTCGLLRPSLKACVWVGDPDCYRDQAAVLWETAQATLAQGLEDRALAKMPSGHMRRRARLVEVAMERGGSTPYNVLPLSNSDSHSSAGAAGHGAGTPLPLCEWWVRYLSRPGDTILDMFGGSGTVAEAALKLGRKAVLIEKEPAYVEMAKSRLELGRDAFLTPEQRANQPVLALD